MRLSRTIHLLLLYASCNAVAASAAVPQFDTGGNLIGALGVVVNSVSFDVAFVDGSCVTAYPSCSDTTVFPFPSLPDSNEAGQQLVQQVFPLADQVNISGCTSSFCQVWFGYAVSGSTEHGVNAINNGGVGSFSANILFDTSSQPSLTRAMWTPSATGTAVNVPLLTIPAQLCLGGLLLYIFRKRAH